MADTRERVIAVLNEHGFDSMQHPELVDDLVAVCAWAEPENARLREALGKVVRRTGRVALSAETVLGLWEIATEALAPPSAPEHTRDATASTSGHTTPSEEDR